MTPHPRAPGTSTDRAVAGAAPTGWWIPHAGFTVAVALVLVSILLMNDGKLIYTLDDPYIHLALAENIPRGTYGVNHGEPSAPASSILYPFLLAPFAGLGILEWMPLALGFAASLATLSLWGRVVRSALPSSREGGHRFLVAGLVTLLIPATNLVGVLFTGMEHSIQLFATALLIAGLVLEREDGVAPWWLWVAIVLGPLIRYENLALSLPALAYLSLRGRVSTSLGILIVLTGLVGGFSAFLLAIGQGPLPTSVQLKTGMMESGGGLEAMVGPLVQNLFHRQGALLAVLGALLAATALRSGNRDDRQLAAWCAAAVALHLVAGHFGWFDRYELYVWSAAILTGLVVFRRPLRALATSTRPFPLLAGATGVVLAAAFPYVYTTLKTPLGSNNIYEQHYQMHRFVTEFYDGPVAVTDIGWVSFRNDRYVLDLFGLAHGAAGEARLRGDDSYMDDLSREHEVGLAMLYGVWYPDLPPRWRPVAELRLEKQLLTPSEAVVTFYVLDASSEARVRSLLRDFSDTLPGTVGFSLLP